MVRPLVSVIIPAHNEAEVITRNLQALRGQIYPNVEVIVVDDDSSDNTVAIAKRYTSHVYRRNHAERSVQRNFGAKHSKGEYLLFLDADMELTPSVISDCVVLTRGESNIGAIAIGETPVAADIWERVKAFEREFYSLEGDPDTDAARFFTRQAFFAAGGYDESLTGPEDWDLTDRIAELGYKIGRVKSRIIHYEHISSLTQLLKKKFYYGLSAHKYFSKHRLSLVGAKSIYFLRPVFYTNWRKLASQPVLALGMILVLAVEQLAGTAGYLVGRFKNT